MNFAHPGTAEILSLLVSLVIPAVSAFLYRCHWNTVLLGTLTVALAATNGFLTEWAATPNHYDWKDGALRALAAFLVAVAAHKGVWKDTPVEGALLRVGSSKPKRRRRRAAAE